MVPAPDITTSGEASAPPAPPQAAPALTVDAAYNALIAALGAAAISQRDRYRSGATSAVRSASPRAAKAVA